MSLLLSTTTFPTIPNRQKLRTAVLPHYKLPLSPFVAFAKHRRFAAAKGLGLSQSPEQNRMLCLCVYPNKVFSCTENPGYYNSTILC